MVLSVTAARAQIVAQIVDGVDNSITPSKLRQVLLDAVDALAYAAPLETYRLRGAWDADSGTFPSETPLVGNVWTVSTAGTVDGVAFDAGDQLLAIVDDASSTTYDGNWLKIDSQVTSAEIAAALGYTPAPIASPTFTGTPAAPTPAAGDSSTKIATTAFVAGSYMPAVLVDSFSGTDDQKIAAANTYAKTLSVPSRIIFPARNMSITSRATLDPPDHSIIDMRGCRITSSSTNSIRIGSTSRNTLGYQVLGANVARASVDASGGSSGIEIRNVCGAFVQIAWVRDHTYGILFTADQPNGGISYSQFSIGIIHDNTYSMHFSASAPNGYINENIFYGGSFNHSSVYPTGVNTIHLSIPDGVPANNNKFYGPSFEDGQSTTYVQAMLFGSLAVANSVYHPRWENGVDQYGHAIRFRPGSEMNQIIGVGNFLDPANMLDESGGKNCWQTAGGDYIARRVSASAGAMQTFFSWWEDAAKVFSFLNLSGVEKGWIKTNGTARFTDLQLAPSASVTPAANGDLVIEKTSNTKLTFKLKGDDAAVRSGSVALGVSTTVGRLARYSDTAGAQAETTGLFEDASGNVGIGTTAPSGKLSVIGAWSILGAATETDSANKGMRIGGLHYLNSQYPVTMIYSYSNVGANTVSIGGGTSVGNAATSLLFYTAANNTTQTGSERLRIDSAGNVGIDTTTPGERLDVAGNIKASGRIIAPNSCKAWVSFSGSTGTISGSHSVSSVTRNSAGAYTITLSSAVATMAVAVSATKAGAVNTIASYAIASSTSITVSVVARSDGSAQDADQVSVFVFGS